MTQLRQSPLAVGLGAAIMASACCMPPVLLVTAGLATSSFLLAWLELKPLFLLLAAAVLTGGLAASLVHGTRACSAKRFGWRLWVYPLISGISFAVGYWLLIGVATPHLYARVEASDRRAVARASHAREPNGTLGALHRAVIKVNPGCDGCAVTLAEVLRAARGVHAAEVDVQRSEAVVLYDPARTSARDIQAKIPYRWFFKPHLRSDVALGVRSAFPMPAVTLSSTLALLVAAGGILALTSAAVWAGSKAG